MVSYSHFNCKSKNTGRLEGDSLYTLEISLWHSEPVASLGAGGGPPLVTPSRGVTPEGKNCVGKFTKNSGETRSDR